MSSGLARQRRVHCPPTRDYFHASLRPDSAHADLISTFDGSEPFLPFIDKSLTFRISSLYML